jgi:hypothetical protein
MTVNIQLITKCIRPQFVWNKRVRWYLCDFSRDDFFCADLGILVFINVCLIKNINPKEIQVSLGLDNKAMDFFYEKLQFIKTATANTEFSKELQRAVPRKTGLVLNLIKHYQILNLL